MKLLVRYTPLLVVAAAFAQPSLATTNASLEPSRGWFDGAPLTEAMYYKHLYQMSVEKGELIEELITCLAERDAAATEGRAEPSGPFASSPRTTHEVLNKVCLAPDDEKTSMSGLEKSIDAILVSAFVAFAICIVLKRKRDRAERERHVLKRTIVSMSNVLAERKDEVVELQKELIACRAERAALERKVMNSANEWLFAG